MTELLLIAALAAIGCGFAVSIARRLLRRPQGDAELVRTAAMVSDGAARYWRRQNAVSVAVAAVLGAIVLLAYGVAYQADVLSAVAPRQFGVWVTAAYVLGVGLTVLAGWVAVWAARHAGARVASGALRSLDESLQVAIRFGAVVGVVVVALVLVGLGGLFIAAYLVEASGDGGAAAVPRIPLLLAGLVLGASFVALLVQVGAGIFGKVADIGADVAGQLDASLPEDAADNPAAIADLVGDTVGDGVGRAKGVFSTTLTALLGAMLVASALFRANPSLPSAHAVVLFPLVVQGFGLLAALFGVMVVRTDDREVPMAALSRGLLVSAALHGVAAVGCCKWLLGPHWSPYAICAVLGCGACVATLYAIQYYSDPKYRPVRALAEAARGGATLATLRGLLTALESVVVIVTIVLVMAVAAFTVGAGSGLAFGGLFGLAAAVLGLLGTAPYWLAMQGMGSVVDTAGGIIEMTVAAARPDVRARAQTLDAVGSMAKALSGTLTAVASAAGCGLLGCAFITEVLQARGGGSADWHFDGTRAGVYVGAVLGLLLVLAFMWATLVRLAQAARDLVYDLRSQLGATATEEPQRETEAEFEREPSAGARGKRLLGGAVGGRPPPADRGGRGADAAAGGDRRLACVEVVSRIALRGMLPPALLGVGVPLLAVAALRIFATDDTVAPSPEALVALLLVATIAGALGSLLFTNAGSAWDNAKKYIETGAHGGRYLVDDGARTARSSPAGRHRESRVDNPTYVAAVIGDTVGDPLKGVVGPASQTLVTTLSTLALVFLPFFL